MAKSLQYISIFSLILFFVGCSSTRRFEKPEDEAFDVIRNVCADLAKQYNKTKRGETSGRVAVLVPTDRTGRYSRITTLISDGVTDELLRLGIAVIEHSRKQQIIEELQAQQSDIYRKENTAKIGELLGARVIGVGVLDEVGSKIVVSYRFLDTEKSDILATAAAPIAKDIADIFYGEEKLTGVYFVSRVSVVVAERKLDGYPWDAMGGEDEKPDPVVTITIGKNRPIQGIKRNTFEAFWEWKDNDPKTLISYDSRDPVTIIVYDKDLWEDDLIGKFEFEHGLPQSQLDSGVIVVGPFGAVKELRIQLKKVQ